MSGSSEWTRFYEEHPEVMEMPPEEVRRRYWAHVPVIVDRARAAAYLRRPFMRIVNFLARRLG